MVLFIAFFGSFLAMFVLGLLSHCRFRRVLWGSFSSAFLLAGNMAMVGTIFGNANEIPVDCPEIVHEFNSVSSDWSTGYLSTGKPMFLPAGIYLACGESNRLVITGKCAFRMKGWWSGMDIFRYREPTRMETKSTLYVTKGTPCRQ